MKRNRVSLIHRIFRSCARSGAVIAAWVIFFGSNLVSASPASSQPQLSSTATQQTDRFSTGGSSVVGGGEITLGVLQLAKKGFHTLCSQDNETLLGIDEFGKQICADLSCPVGQAMVGVDLGARKAKCAYATCPAGQAYDSVSKSCQVFKSLSGFQLTFLQMLNLICPPVGGVQQFFLGYDETKTPPQPICRTASTLSDEISVELSLNQSFVDGVTEKIDCTKFKCKP